MVFTGGILTVGDFDRGIVNAHHDVGCDSIFAEIWKMKGQAILVIASNCIMYVYTVLFGM